MRITGGRFRSRQIKTCEGPGYRPATARVREALFSMLTARGLVWEGARVLDVFAGSGSLAMESLSRGASFALLIELNKKAAGVISSNLKALGLGSSQAKVLNKDVGKVLLSKPDRPFDMVFIDPPYGKDLFVPALGNLLKNDWLVDGGFLAAEVEAGLELPEGLGEPELEAISDKCYGQTRILVWKKRKSA